MADITSQALEVTMIISIVFLIPFLAIAFLPSAADTLFSADELNEIGVCLEDSETEQSGCRIERSDHVLPQVTSICGNA